MFKTNKNDRTPSWYPGAQVIRDRWGTQLNTDIGGREFSPRAEAPDSIVNTMRWSLGLM
ncbi:MAG: hypothetical protein OXR84_01190 [Magnetovibrio sp.]|nr:hypothetical protein [Magnetovibrio sp.]